MPNDFNGCENFFDKLTILKHFNCPSRLLDITKNPLIAAFFALDEYGNNQTAEYGQIHCCFPKNFDAIKNSQNSDSISLLSALCTTNKSLYCSELVINIKSDISFIDSFKNSYDKLKDKKKLSLLIYRQLLNKLFSFEANLDLLLNNPL